MGFRNCGLGNCRRFLKRDARWGSAAGYLL
jgi:hypothetical protein